MFKLMNGHAWFNFLSIGQLGYAEMLNPLRSCKSFDMPLILPAGLSLVLTSARFLITCILTKLERLLSQQCHGMQEMTLDL